MRFPCLVLDHDDTVVNSTAVIHFPSFLAYLAQVRPGLSYTLDDYFRKNFDPGIIPLFKDELGFTDEELEGDEMLPAAVDVILETGQASVSMLQRRLKLGYARAARIVDEMEEKGIVGPFQGSKPRAILITKEQWAAKKGGQTEQMGFDDLDAQPDELM